MQFTCTINDKAHLKFYLVHEDSKILLSKSRCLAYGKKKIDMHLNKFNLLIRPINRDDVKYLRSPKRQENLCGDMDLNIPPILGDMEDYTGNDVSFMEEENSVRITFVLCHKSNPRVVLGFISAIVNYKEKSFRSDEHPIVGLYKRLEQMDTLFIDLGCSSEKYNEIVTGTNYFIRAYVLLVALENKPINVVWGQNSGSSQGTNAKLWRLHQNRGCIRYRDTNMYTCDTFTFLNNFFRRMDANDLLRYTKRHVKKK